MPAASATVALVAALAVGGAAGDPTVVLRIQSREVTESSGLAASVRHDGVLWTHNDGGRAARVFALDRRGRTVATVTLRGVDPYDPEALAPGRDPQGRPVLYLGDIGDNRAVRPDVSVFRFREPARLRDAVVDAAWFRLTYPDGPRDAEALMVDPRDGRLWVAAKDVFGAGLFRAPARLRTDRPNVLERVGDVPGLVTDGAFLADGRFVLRTYTSVYLYSAPDRLVARGPLPAQPQGESLAVDGDRLLVGSEGVASTVYAVGLPSAPPPSGEPTRSPSVAATPATGAPGGAPGAAPGRGGVAVGVGLALLGLGTLAAVRRRRPRGGRGGRR